jgi:hypothetical protein
MKNTTPLEEQEQQWLVQWLNAKGLLFYAIPNSQDLSGVNRVHARNAMEKLKRMGLQPGVQDIVVLLPKYALYIELKRQKGGVVAENQKKWHRAINGLEYCHAVFAKGFGEAVDIIEGYL